jgi:hypothetical protein
VGLFLTTTLLLPLLVSCTVNSVRPISSIKGVKDGRAILVYGVGVEGDWKYPAFGVQLDEYSLVGQATMGNCFQYNRTEARVPAAPGATHYFAFDVPAGHYVYSAFQTVPLDQGAQAIAVPAGRTVYVGDFVYTKAGVVALRQDWEGLKRSTTLHLPGVDEGISRAQTVAVRPPKPFMCTP